MAELHRRLLVAGITARPLAASAARAGWRVTAVDAFGDLDLRVCARVIPLRREDGGFDAAAAASAGQGVSAAYAAYASNFENHPSSVAALAAGRRLLGNRPSVLRRVRDPVELMRALRRRGFETPVTRAAAPGSRTGGPHRWLIKPRRSGGGHGTSAWRPGRPVGRHQYLQERIRGTPGSIVFLADGKHALVLGLSRQLVGDRTFGAGGFRYCGSLMGEGLFQHEAALLDRARALAEAVAGEFGLVGLNGIDFIARAGIPWPIEVNPRWSASMELLEGLGDRPLFAQHAEACLGRLPAAARYRIRGTVGKAVVFARRELTLGATRAWLRDPSIADVPHPGEHVPRGRPICTVFASAKGPDACLRALAARAAAIYRAVDTATRGAA
jgi:predicted ATP-grasp superfamily ATP-dependent carboligase